MLTQIAALNTQIGQLVLAGAQLDPATLAGRQARPGAERPARPARQAARRARRSSPTSRASPTPTRTARRSSSAGSTVGRRRRRRDVPTRAPQIDAQFTVRRPHRRPLQALEDALLEPAERGDRDVVSRRSSNKLAHGAPRRRQRPARAGFDLDRHRRRPVLRLRPATAPPGAAAGSRVDPAILAEPDARSRPAPPARAPARLDQRPRA